MTKPKTPPHTTIAEACGVALSTVRNWAAGGQRPPADVAVVLADLVGAEQAIAILRWWGEKWRAKHPSRTAGE